MAVESSKVPLKGGAAPAYGTGRSTSLRSGYVRIREPSHPLAGRDGYVYEHRKVLYDAGVPIPPGSNVHHRNGDKADNRLENLEVLAHGEHSRHHHPPGTLVTNQFGTFVVGTPEERRERERTRVREAARRRRAAKRAGA